MKKVHVNVGTIGHIDEWHVDLKKAVTVDNLGGYPACPNSTKKRDLRAIRPLDLRAQAEVGSVLRTDTRTRGWPHLTSHFQSPSMRSWNSRSPAGAVTQPPQRAKSAQFCNGLAVGQRW